MHLLVCVMQARPLTCARPTALGSTAATLEHIVMENVCPSSCMLVPGPGLQILHFPPSRGQLGALILSPTRELATQIYNEALKLLTFHSNLHAEVCTGYGPLHPPHVLHSSLHVHANCTCEAAPACPGSDHRALHLERQM